MKVSQLEDVVTEGLCAGCGICQSLAGQKSVQMSLNGLGYMRPKILQNLPQDTLQEILRVCPGVSVTGPDKSQIEPDGKMNPVYGPIVSIHRGWAADEQVRFKAAAGGALTALGCYLIESGLVEAVLHVKASDDRPLETDSHISTTRQMVIDGSQSRYGAAAPLQDVHRLLDDGKVFAVIAKPCDIAAIRNLAKIDDRVDRQIPYCLTNFCGGVPSIPTAEKIAAFHGLEAKEISLFRWRGNGWPGPTHVESHDGRVFDLTYDQVWYDDQMPWSYDMQFRCKICPDAIGELADVACPDGWVMKNGQPVHDEAPGANLFIARTRKGAALVQAAHQAGAISLEGFSIDELERMHGDHKPRKTAWPTRLLGLWSKGQARPKVRRYRVWSAVFRAGLRHSWHSFIGTRARVSRRANKEPLA